MRKNLVLLFFSLVFTFSVVAQKNDFPKFKTLNMGYEDHHYSASTHNEGKVFALPNTNSKVLWQHKKPFVSLITPLSKATVKGVEWYYVLAYNSMYDTVRGYLRQADFVKYTFRGKDARYCIINDKGTNGGNNYKVVKVSKTGLDTLTVGSPSHYLRAKFDYFKPALTNVNSFLDLEFYRASCPGTYINVLVADCGDSLTILTKSFYTGEAGWSESIIPYIPIKFGSGKVLLVANGDVKNIFNTHTAKLNTFDYSKNIGVPIDELVVIVKENYAPIEADRQSADDYSDPETKRTLYVEEYYKWKDNKLSLVKTVKK